MLTRKREPFNLCIFGSRPNAKLMPPEKIDPYDRWKYEFEDRLVLQIPPFQSAFFGAGGVLTGCAAGADRAGELWADKHKIPVYSHPALWNVYGKGAGFVRNAQMAHLATHFLALWDGESRGTAHMIQTVRELKKPLIIVRLDKEMFR